MRLLRAGIDTSVIALWLGHEQIGSGRATSRNIEVIGAQIKELVFDFRRHDPS